MIRNVQVLRALAALIVVCVHLGDLLGTVHLPPFGGGGVDLFFVISGFVMVHTTQVRPPAPGQFIKNRIARIVPMYWLLTLVVFFIAAFDPTWVKATTADGMQLVKSLLFIPFQKSNGLMAPVLFVGWTLNYEMFFYALFALGLLCRNYLLGLAGVFVILSILVLLGLTLRPVGTLSAFYTGARIFEFALGMVIGVLTDRAPKQVPNAVRWLVLLSLIGLPAIIFAPFIWPDAISTISCGVPSMILVAGVVLLERWGWRVGTGPLLAVGDASYVLYLSHPFVTVPIEKLAMHRLHPTGWLSFALVGVCLALVTLVALLLHKMIERPLSNVVRRLIATRPLESQPA